MEPEARFDEVIAGLASNDRVSVPGEGRGFGSNALRVDGRVFAMLARRRLVVKLPKRRVDALVLSGDGKRFDANKGTPMKEWLSLDPGSGIDWAVVAQEAMAFVGAPQQRRARS